MKISIVCASTQRPKQFALLQKCLINQTLPPDEFICVGEDHTGYELETDLIELVTRDTSNDDKDRHSMTYNLQVALEKCTGDLIHIWEDSDFYADSYTEKMTGALCDGARLVGINFEIYYYLVTRQIEFLTNATHCTLATTSFNRTVYEKVMNECRKGNVYMDSTIWSLIRRKVCIHNLRMTEPYHYHIGFKGCGELPPITKHNPPSTADYDHNFNWLSRCIGRQNALAYGALVASNLPGDFSAIP